VVLLTNAQLEQTRSVEHTLSLLLLLLLVVLQVYREAVESERCSVIHLTHVDAQPECDTFFPDITAEGEPGCCLGGGEGGQQGGWLLVGSSCDILVSAPDVTAEHALGCFLWRGVGWGGTCVGFCSP
jgi:hypothetical protein